MIRFFSFPAVLLLLSLVLVSCAGIEPAVETRGAVTRAGETPRFAAWQEQTSSRSPVAANRAVKELLRQADALINKNAMEQASDKLERLLRIEPGYAQAWSRLAWIALQGHYSERSRQMAQRSNSYAFDNNNLKRLNWSFIREASALMNDAWAINEAERMIKSLGSDR